MACFYSALDLTRRILVWLVPSQNNARRAARCSAATSRAKPVSLLSKSVGLGLQSSLTLWSILRTAYVVFVLAHAFLTGCVAGIATNVPNARLEKGYYVSPGGEYRIFIPHLITPGARIEERQVDSKNHGIYFADDFGRVFYILQTDNSKTKFSLESIANEFSGPMVREKYFTTTSSGSELRLTRINAGASPLITRSREEGKRITRKNDLFEAWSIFLHDDRIYQVTVGVTRIGSPSKSELEFLQEAKSSLDAFLKGLVMTGKVKP